MDVLSSPLFSLLVINVIKAHRVVVVLTCHSLSNIHVELTEIHLFLKLHLPPKMQVKGIHVMMM